MKRTMLGILVLVLAGCGTASITAPAGRELHSPAPVYSAMPSTFIGVFASAENQKMSLLSSQTGAVLRVLAAVGPDFTNNGVTRSPDGRWIYATWIGKHSLRIERISAAGGPRTFIAYGSQPTISPDGRYLAYITGKDDHFLAVRDLRGDRTRKWNLSPLIGNKVSLFNGQLLWSGSGELVALPEEFGQRVSAMAPASKNSGKCAGATCLVHFYPRDARSKPALTRLHDGQWSDFYSGGTAAPGSIVASRMVGEKTELDLIEISGGSRRHLVTIPGMPLALDRAGTHLLHLVGHSPPALWRARILDGRLVDRQRLIPSAHIFGALAW